MQSCISFMPDSLGKQASKQTNIWQRNCMNYLILESDELGWEKAVEMDKKPEVPELDLSN